MPKGKSKKTGVVMVIAVGGKPPKKPEKTSDVKKEAPPPTGINTCKHCKRTTFDDQCCGDWTIDSNGVSVGVAYGLPDDAPFPSPVKKADMCTLCDMKLLPSGECAGCRAKARTRGPIAQGAIDRREGKTQAAPQTMASTPTPQEEDAERERMKGNLRTGAPMDLSWRMLKAKKKSKPFHGYNPKRHHKKGGLSAKGRAKFKRETGANLKPPVTTKPSKLKAGSKKAKRRKSFCARMTGVKGPTSKKGKLTPKGAALKRWNC